MDAGGSNPVAVFRNPLLVLQLACGAYMALSAVQRRPLLLRFADNTRDWEGRAVRSVFSCQTSFAPGFKLRSVKERNLVLLDALLSLVRGIMR